MEDTTAAETSTETAAEAADPAASAQDALSMLAGGENGSATDSQTQAETDDGGNADETPDASEDDGEELGDAGKRAIDRMKDERNKAIRSQKRAEKQLAEAKSTIAHMRIEKFATGRLRSPEDAFAFLTDLNGDEDEKTISKAIDRLVSEKPYLAPEREESKQAEKPANPLETLFGSAESTLKPSDQNTVNADQFGGVLEQLGISI